MEALEVRGVFKSYRDQSVLCDVDLALKEGSFTSVLGPSGSGKTTLLRVIAGFDRIDQGEVRISGTLVDDGSKFVTPDRRRIGYVPQEGSLFPHLTVQQNVGFGLKRSPQRANIVEEHLAMLDLEELGRRYPHELSGGQQQRVAIARALAINPSLVLLDEPFSALDDTLRSAVRTDVRRVIRAAGATALLVTHDQDEALSLSDEVAMIRSGRIWHVATPQALYEHPESPELAGSLGEANFLDGTGKGAWVDTALGALRLSSGEFPEGLDLVVLIRPEQIMASRGLGEGPSATILEREFHGHDVVLRLMSTWNPPIPLTSRQLTSRHTEVSRSVIGSRVSLSVRGTVLAWPRE
jgi:iron(III) transport system ATP-binding protein